MARRGRGADDRLLEAVALDGSPLAAAASPIPRRPDRAHQSDPRAVSRRRRLVPWVAAATVALVAGVGLPVRAKLAVAELGRVARAWTTARSAVEQRQVVISRLEELATPNDASLLATGEAALDDEVAGILHGVAHDLTAAVVVDGGVRRVRRAVVTWLDDEAIDRLEHVRITPAVTEQAMAAASTALGSQQQRWHAGGGDVALAAPAVTLHGADRVLATLGHFADQPTGTRLVANDGVAFSVVDVDLSRAESTQPGGVDLGTPDTAPVALVPRAGYLVFVAAHTAWAMPTGVSGTARQLGTARDALASTRPDTVWLVDTPFRGLVKASEVDGQGTVVRGPYSVALRPIAVVSDGLLVNSNDGAGLAVIDPATSKTVRDIASNGMLVASSPDQIAWLPVDPASLGLELHLTAGPGGPDRVVPAPAGAKALGPGTFSPDGRYLATAFFDGAAQPAAFRLAILDLATGRFQSVSGALSDAVPQALAWTPDSSRVFVSSDADRALDTYRLGDPAISYLRVTGLRARQLIAFSTDT